MLKHFKLMLFFLVFIPVSSNAAVINIEYTGHVVWLDGAGLGHSLGENISGSARIDLDKVGFVWSDGEKTRYESLGNHGLVETGYTSPADGYGMDFISVFNNTYKVNDDLFEDRVEIIDATNGFDSATGAGLYNSIQFYFSFQGIDWLTSDSIANLNIDSSEPVFLGPSFGVKVFSRSIQNSLGEFEYFTETAGFMFDSLKISTTTVPESSSFALMLLGALGLCLRRKVQ